MIRDITLELLSFTSKVCGCCEEMAIKEMIVKRMAMKEMAIKMEMIF